jgi:hypothetical protein
MKRMMRSGNTEHHKGRGENVQLWKKIKWKKRSLHFARVLLNHWTVRVARPPSEEKWQKEKQREIKGTFSWS